MESRELLVELKIPDVTALTAGGALRRRMGYAEVLKSLKRADYYRLDLNVCCAEEATVLATELAEKTNIFVNPNKHIYRIRAGSHEHAPAKAGRQIAQVLITDPNDGSAQGALAALQGRLGYADRVTGLLKGVLWTMELECATQAEAESLAKDIAITRARDRGLLMNPHFQECEVF